MSSKRNLTRSPAHRNLSMDLDADDRSALSAQRLALGNSALQDRLRERDVGRSEPSADGFLAGDGLGWGVGAWGDAQAADAVAPDPSKARAERRSERKDQRQEKRAEGRAERVDRRERRQLGRDGELPDHLSQLDAEYEEHLGFAVTEGKAAFREQLEDLCMAKVVTGSLRRLAHEQITTHADDAAAAHLAVAEIDALASQDGAGDAEVAYTTMKLDAMVNGYRGRQLDRKFEAELFDGVIRRAALDTCAPFIDEQVADPALETAIEDGAAVAYQRSLTYLDGAGNEAASAVGLTALATQLANPVVAPVAALAMIGTAVVDELLGDPQEAATRAAEREARQFFRRGAKKAVRRDPRFDRDGAYARQAAAAVPSLVQDAAMQQEAFDSVMAEVTGQSMVDGFQCMAGEWESALDQSGQGVVADAGLESGLWVSGKLKIPVPIPGLHKVAYFFLDLGAKLTTETGANMAILLSVRGGLGAQIKLGSAVSAAIEAGLKITLSSSGANMAEVMQQLSYAFFRAFDAHMVRESQANVDTLAREPLITSERRSDEDDQTSVGRVIQERIVGGLWGMGGQSGAGAYEEAQAWAAMVEEQMVASGGKASFSAGLDIHGGLGIKVGDEEEGGDKHTTTVKTDGLKFDNDGLDAVIPDKVKISADVGAQYVGELSQGEDGGVEYTDKMQEYVILKGSFGPIDAYVKFFFDQEVGDDKGGPDAQSGLLQYGLTLTMPTNDVTAVARILADGPGGIVAPLELLMGEWKGRDDNPLGREALADTTQHGDPGGNLADLVDNDVRKLIVDTGVDDNLEGIAHFLSLLGELQIQLVGQKVMYGSTDGLDYGGGWNNSLILRSMLDVNLADETKTKGTADKVMELDFKAWSEHAELVLSQQTRS